MHDPESGEKLLEWFDEVQRWARTSLPAGPPETISYGESSEQVIDVWRPEGGGDHRLVVSIHGGGFSEKYRRETQEPWVRHLVTRGCLVANVEYRRAGSGGGIVETTSDVDAAIEALAGADGIPSGRFAVLGHSAGGYLALWAAGRPEVDLALALCPVTDLVGWGQRDRDRAEQKIAWAGAAPADAPDLYAHGDLVRRMPTGTRTVVMHGGRDRSVPHQDSVKFAELSRNAGQPVQLEVFETEGHFAWLDPRLPAFRAAHDVLAGAWV